MILDALGTRGIWTRGDPKRVARSLGQLNQAFKSGVGRGRPAGRTPYSRLAELNGLEQQDIFWECQTVSDTVIAIARTSGPLGTLLLYVAVEAIPLIALGFQEGHPFRGAISTGTCYEAASALIGPAVDEAAEWYDKSEWAGVVLTPSAALELEAAGKELKLANGPAFVKHRIPMKDGPFDGYAVNWPLDTVSRKAIVAAFTRPPVAIGVARKLGFTLAFYDEYHH